MELGYDNPVAGPARPVIINLNHVIIMLDYDKFTKVYVPNGHAFFIDLPLEEIYETIRKDDK